MRSVRVRILAVLAVLVAVGVGGWQLLPSKMNDDKTITVGTTDAVTSLDPAGAYDAGSWALFSNVFQSLLTFEPGGAAPVPDAAKSCGFVGGGLRTYACTLRDDLTFPSGSKVTAEDVKFSFDRVKAINSEVGPASLFSTLGSVDAKGLKVTFHLSSPDATFPFKVATGAGSIVDHARYAKHALRKDAGADGTGVYVLKTYTKDKRAVLAPNKHYKGAVKGSGTPTVLRYYATPAALESAWKAKQVDVATRQLTPATLAALSPSDPDQHVTEADSAETRNLVLNVRASSPLHNLFVRQAVAALINREQLVSQTYKGTTEPLYGLIPAGITGHSTSFFDAYPKPDAKKAKALLTEAGVSLPVRFTYGYAEGRGAAGEEAAELKRQLEAGGLFKVDIKGYEWTDFQKRYAEGKLDAWAVGWVADFPDPDTFSTPLVGTGNSMKNGYSSKDVDRLIQDSQHYEDRSRVSDDFRALQERVARDVPLIPLWQRKEYVLSSEDVGGGQYLSDGTGVFRLWRLNWI
ncbi:ABC transporter substrate-binding protein [Streptomyces sp. NBC_01340]|uniref:ABC transporter substrate-binding protein n=1 Tax=unclassified Streptomyces TaxID=2593676 RepID=UPI00225B065F|nr:MULTISPECIES: ABC transporter substrate-binding protein [unclassified Streptomyces]MCX4456305.1 ABC transporter substrate-binding protein [Streptomyces sp. NBC_01719]MCX4495663.1 ABC transporter substrate-binding protein [Streptomyces sp. NBC_01728]WSI40609.1 ABC transporter substrate-binding protein [Streptomyces sp. NBC_01340]